MSILDHYSELISDPAHTLVELTYILLVDVVLLGICWPLIKRHFHHDIKVEHEILDEEHGVAHKHSRPTGSNVKVIPPK